MNKLTLFHTTTDFYLPSIMSSGLGGTNPNKVFGIYNFLVSITPLCEKYLQNNKRYKNIKFSNDQMVSQSSVGTMSFRHDKICLATETSTAIRYCVNKYGSELLTRIILLNDLLIEAGHEKEIDKSVLKIDLDYVKQHQHRKIILMIKDISVEEIETENGENAKKKLEEYEQIRLSNPKYYEILLQQLNFSLLKPIPVNRINISEVDNIKLDIDMANSKGSVDYKLKKYR